VLVALFSLSTLLIAPSLHVPERANLHNCLSADLYGRALQIKQQMSSSINELYHFDPEERSHLRFTIRSNVLRGFIYREKSLILTFPFRFPGRKNPPFFVSRTAFVLRPLLEPLLTDVKDASSSFAAIINRRLLLLLLL
jgi:hypothetical protein